VGGRQKTTLFMVSSSKEKTAEEEGKVKSTKGKK